MIQRRLEFLKAVRTGRYVLNELVWWASCEGLHSLGRICFLAKSLTTKSVIQRRLEFMKAVRLGRCILNELVWSVPWEGLHSLGLKLIWGEMLECSSVQCTYVDMGVHICMYTHNMEI